MTKFKKHTIFHWIITVFSCFIKALVWGIIGFAFVAIGSAIMNSKKSPLDILLGIPMVVVGFGFIVHGLFDVAICTFSLKYNKAVCFLCSLT